MTDNRPSDLLSALPRSRPQRRSAKRPARPSQTPEAEVQPATETPAEARRTTKPAPNGAKARSAPRTDKSARPTAKPTRRAAKPAKARSGAEVRSPAAASTSTIRPAGDAPARRTKRLAQPAQPRGVPRAKRGARPEPSTEFPVFRTALQAAAELTEIGVTLSAKALRRAIGRLPRP